MYYINNIYEYILGKYKYLFLLCNTYFVFYFKIRKQTKKMQLLNTT